MDTSKLNRWWENLLDFVILPGLIIFFGYASLLCFTGNLP